MSEGNVVTLPPKSARGQGKNYKWFITFNRDTKKFGWRVEFTMHSVLVGEEENYVDAQHKVQEAVRRVRS
jgi:hypothetical protein